MNKLEPFSISTKNGLDSFIERAYRAWDEIILAIPRSRWPKMDSSLDSPCSRALPFPL